MLRSLCVLARAMKSLSSCLQSGSCRCKHKCRRTRTILMGVPNLCTHGDRLEPRARVGGLDRSDREPVLTHLFVSSAVWDLGIMQILSANAFIGSGWLRVKLGANQGGMTRWHTKVSFLRTRSIRGNSMSWVSPRLVLVSTGSRMYRHHGCFGFCSPMDAHKHRRSAFRHESRTTDREPTDIISLERARSLWKKLSAEKRGARRPAQTFARGRKRF